MGCVFGLVKRAEHSPFECRRSRRFAEPEAGCQGGCLARHQGGLLGIAVCEDSEAVSQSLDDFLEGSPMFARAKAWLHRRGGLRFGVRVIGSPLASGPHGARFAPGVDEWACLQALLDLPAIADSPQSASPSTQVVKDKPSPNRGRADIAMQVGPCGTKGGWTSNLTRSCGSIWKTRIHGKATSLACEPRRGRR